MNSSIPRGERSSNSQDESPLMQYLTYGIHVPVARACHHGGPNFGLVHFVGKNPANEINTLKLEPGVAYRYKRYLPQSKGVEMTRHVMLGDVSFGICHLLVSFKGVPNSHTV
jgi:hypothetical protein